MAARYSRAGRAALRPCKVGLVVPDDVLLEHSDVAVGGLDIEVPEEGGTDVDRQAMVHEISGEQPAEVVGVNR